MVSTYARARQALVDCSRRIPMAKVLLLYSTTDGHTVEICKRLRSVIEQAGDSVELVEPYRSADAGRAGVRQDRNWCEYSLRQAPAGRLRVHQEQPGSARIASRTRCSPSTLLRASLRRTRPKPIPTCRNSSSKSTGTRRTSAVFAGKISYPRLRLCRQDR